MIYKRAIILGNDDIITIGDRVEYEIKYRASKHSIKQEARKAIVTKINDTEIEFNHNCTEEYSQILDMKKLKISE